LKLSWFEGKVNLVFRLKKKSRKHLSFREKEGKIKKTNFVFDVDCKLRKRKRSQGGKAVSDA
jgi:hypothetical protein